MVKNWQSENKKVKNPPPMPDFTQPRMKKPELYKVIEESGHKIIFTLIAEGKQQPMKLDYRKEIQQKRKAN